MQPHNARTNIASIKISSVSSNPTSSYAQQAQHLGPLPHPQTPAAEPFSPSLIPPDSPRPTLHSHTTKRRKTYGGTPTRTSPLTTGVLQPCLVKRNVPNICVCIHKYQPIIPHTSQEPGTLRQKNTKAQISQPQFRQGGSRRRQASLCLKGSVYDMVWCG